MSAAHWGLSLGAVTGGGRAWWLCRGRAAVQLALQSSLPSPNRASTRTCTRQPRPRRPLSPHALAFPSPSAPSPFLHRPPLSPSRPCCRVSTSCGCCWTRAARTTTRGWPTTSCACTSWAGAVCCAAAAWPHEAGRAGGGFLVGGCRCQPKLHQTQCSGARRRAWPRGRAAAAQTHNGVRDTVGYLVYGGGASHSIRRPTRNAFQLSCECDPAGLPPAPWTPTMR